MLPSLAATLRYIMGIGLSVSIGKILPWMAVFN